MAPAEDGLSITYSCGKDGQAQPPDLRFLHYNDVYHVESGSSDPVGGIARFQSVVNYYRTHACYAGQPELLAVFSGDAFNPSLESTVTKGRHMIPFLNNIGTNVACVGNHDLDFGIAQFRHLRSQCKFPWLLANVLDPALGENVALANCERTTMLTASNGLKIGVIGLGEREWLDTINSIPPDLVYKSASETAKELVPSLRDEGANIIVAVTHQREPNDYKLAEKMPPGLVDLILSGHDHFYAHRIVNGVHVLRSGSDFKQLSYIEAWKRGSGGWDFSITRRDIVRSIPEDPETVGLVEKLTSTLKSRLEKPVGYTASPLDGRFTTVRSRESNLGNFVCDLMRFYYGADCAIMASGTIRGDQVYPPGILKLKDILNCFPFEDPVVVLKLSGKAIHDALENGVSQVPALEGRFPQVSNIAFAFNPLAPSGSRVTWANIGTEPLKLDAEYTLATRGYMARGKDGYTSLLAKSEGGEAHEVIPEESGMLISTILRQYFLSLKVLGKWHNWCMNLDRHWDKVHNKLHVGGWLVQSPSLERTAFLEGKECTLASPSNPVVLANNESPTTTHPLRPKKSTKVSQPLFHRYGRYYNGHTRNHVYQHRHVEDKPKRSNSRSAATPHSTIQQAPLSVSEEITGDGGFDSSGDGDGDGYRSYRPRKDRITPPRPAIIHDLDSESDLEPEILTSAQENMNYVVYSSCSAAEEERRLRLARQVIRKWMRLAGLDTTKVGCVDDANVEFTPPWTSGVAPRVEGRIIIEKGGSIR